MPTRSPMRASQMKTWGFGRFRSTVLAGGGGQMDEALLPTRILRGHSRGKGPLDTTNGSAHLLSDVDNVHMFPLDACG
eukprot:3439914-Pyramimonas_sp.AAC.2